MWPERNKKMLTDAAAVGADTLFIFQSMVFSIVFKCRTFWLKVIKNNEVGVVLCGKQADTNAGSTGPKCC